MRYVVAFLVSVLLIVGMFAFQSHVRALQDAWEEANVSLAAPQQLLISVAQAITNYWYAVAMVIFGICFGVAAFMPRRPSDEQPR